MKRITLLALILFGLTFGSQAQKLSKEEVARYDTEIRTMLNYLEETLNFIGDSTATAMEKEIIFTESWSKIFIDDKVQIEDDLDVNRKTPINKDVQAYLKDIDFFFKWANFKFDVQSIANNQREDGTVYFKATLSRHLTAKTINDEPVDNIKNRFVEINLDRQKSSLKIASIYTSKINETEELCNWWNSLSTNWKKRLGEGIRLYDSIPLETVGMITNADFMASYPIVDPMTGETELQDKFFKTETDMKELYAKLKLVTQKQVIDISNIREIISVEPLSELSDLTLLNISGTSVDDISPLRNANKLKTLYANSILIDDISSLKYCITLEELEVANTNISDLSVLASLRNLKKINLTNTMVTRLTDLKNCPNLTTLNLSGCKMSNIVPLQELTQLKNVDISNTSIRDLTPLSQLSDLQSINISGTAVTNLQALSQLENLRELNCSQTNISDLSPLKNHRKLSKIYCDQSRVTDEEASAFTKENRFTLVIYDTEALRNWWNQLPIYWKAIFSKQIEVSETEPTTEQLHQIINMQTLNLADNTYIQNLLPVSRFTNLKTLNIANTEINSLFAIQNLSNIEILDISNTHINSLEPLKDMRNLKHLIITGTPITDLTPLINDDNIEVIIADNINITTQEVVALKEKQRQVTVVYQTEALQQWWNNLDDIWKAILSNEVSMQYTNAPTSLELQKIIDLREINISTDYPISNLEPLRNCIWLESLDISNQSVRDLSPMENKQYLKELYVQNTPITSLKPLENDVMMEILNIENTQIDDLGPISKMTNLVTLNAGGTSIKSLKPLQNLDNLENLYINNTSVKNLSPIENLPKLKTLKAYNTKLNNKKIESLQQKRLDLNIIYY
jgi:Leucine-rich repeat (LRR) protein